MNRRDFLRLGAGAAVAAVAPLPATQARPAYYMSGSFIRMMQASQAYRPAPHWLMLSLRVPPKKICEMFPVRKETLA